MTPAFKAQRQREDVQHSPAAALANAHGMRDGIGCALRQATEVCRELVNSSAGADCSEITELINKFNRLKTQGCGDSAFSNMTYRSCSVRYGRA